jgi:hypothetical protein
MLYCSPHFPSKFRFHKLITTPFLPILFLSRIAEEEQKRQKMEEGSFRSVPFTYANEDDTTANNEETKTKEIAPPPEVPQSAAHHHETTKGPLPEATGAEDKFVPSESLPDSIILVCNKRERERNCTNTRGFTIRCPSS